MDVSSRRLAEYATGLTVEDLPDEVVQRTQRLVLDSISCAIGAYTSQPSKILRDLYKDRATGGDRATVFGSGDRIEVEYAALINSTMGRYLDFNDCYVGSYGGGHPSDHVPALLSVAEAEGATGADLIEAIVVAYDIQCRGIETGAVYRQGFDYQAVWAAHSAAAAVGKLMGLSEGELVDAIGITGTAQNGLLIARRGAVSMWKAVAVPYVLHSAIQACSMARGGLTGPADLFDGRGGVFDAVTRGEVTFPPFGPDDHRVMQTNIKPYVGCYQALSAVSGTIDVVSEHDIDPGDVESVSVRTYDSCIDSCAGAEKWDPDLSRGSADHSLPYMLAVAIMDRDLGVRQYEDDRLRNPRVHDLMQRVGVEADEGLNTRKEQNTGMMPTIVEIETAGRTYETTVEYPPGHYERPLTDAEHDEKIDSLLGTFLGDEQVAVTKTKCASLPELDQVDDVVQNLVI